MNKINIQEITDLIAGQTGQTKKFSEQFLRELVDVIGEYLQKDGIVKVKGLGTFKVIRVEDRKSVDVATGNEIILPSHNKVQFIPENAVKQQVNAPFSHLSTTTVSNPVAEPAELHKPVDSAKTVKPSDSAEPSNTEELKEGGNGGSHWWVVLVVLVVILGTLFLTRPYWLPYIENWAGIGHEQEVVVVEPVVEDTVEAMVDSTLLMYQDSVSNAEAGAFAVNDSDVVVSDKFDIHTYTYKMAAEAPVREIVTVLDGSRLTMVAYRAYGSKDFWVYVYDANRDVLRTPGGVNKGMELKIADLPHELVDPESQEAVEFAKELGQKY